MAIIPKAAFPNVPKLPGVPQLARSSRFPPALPPILNLAIAAAKLWQSIFTQPQWGIYSTGGAPTTNAGGVFDPQAKTSDQLLVKPDSIGEFSYHNEWSMSDFPTQDGAFATYDKVANPFEIMVRLYKGGSTQARKKFLDSIEAIAGTLDFYKILTPEKTYLNVNILRVEINRRGPKGAYFLTEVDVFFREVRVVTASYTKTAVVTQNARDPSAVPVANAGTVQAQPTDLKTGEP